MARAGHCVIMEIRILSQVTALRDCCCLLAIYSPPCGNTSCSWNKNLGSSAASDEIPANLDGKGTPVCTNELPWNLLELPWNLLVLLSWELCSHPGVLPWEGSPSWRSPAWKSVPEWLSWDQSCSRSVDFLKRWIFPFWLELGTWLRHPLRADLGVPERKRDSGECFIFKSSFIWFTEEECGKSGVLQTHLLWNYGLSRILLPLDFPVGMRLCFTFGDAAWKGVKDWSFF